VIDLLSQAPYPVAVSLRHFRGLAAWLRGRELWLASSVTVASLLLAFVEVGIYADHGPPHRQALFATMELCQYALQGSALAVAGLVQLARRSARVLGWIILGGALPFMAAACLSTWLRYTTDITPATRVAVYTEAALWEIPRILFALLALFFPNGRLPGRWARPFAAGLVAAIVLNEVRTTIGLRQWTPGGVPMANALYQPGSLSLGNRFGPVLELLIVVGITLSALSPLLRWRGGDRVTRRQIAIALPGFVLFLVEEWLRNACPSATWASAAGIALAVLWPAAIGYVVVQNRLYELDLAARRIVAGAVPVVLLAAVYAGAALGLSSAMPHVGAVLASLAVLLAALIGLVLRPVSGWVLGRLDRLMYGDRAEPYLIARRLAARLRDSVSDSDVPETVCQIVVSALRLPAAALETTAGGQQRLFAEVGRPFAGGVLEPFDLRYRGQRVGRLMVQPRTRQDRLDELDRSALQSLADLAAPAVSALTLHQELRQSQVRLLGAREEERQRICQDVHDELGPLLAAVRLRVDTAAALLPAGSPGAPLLADASEHLQRVVGEMRLITENQPPTAVARQGLPAALAELAGRLSGAALRIELALPGQLPPVPSTVATAAYRIAAEALTNVIRHARATQATVRVTATATTLTIAVSDNGTGIRSRPAGRAGMGLRSMAARARELGGTCQVRRRHGGTTVTARLPLPDPGGDGTAVPDDSTTRPGRPAPSLESAATGSLAGAS
jgi:two-component system, NarL family, sensor kinase